MKKEYLHGSPEVWDDVFEGVDLEYSDTPQTQNQLFEYLKLSFLKEIFPTGNKSMLEVGCGTAFVSLFFAKRGYRLSCLDVNKNILKVAQKNFKKQGAKAKFIVGNAEKLPFRDNQFDVVASFGLLEHFEDPAVAISEMVRVTKPKGIFFADIVPNRFSTQTIGNAFNLIASLVFWSIKGKPGKGFKKGMRNFRPLYFENSIGWINYRRIIKEAGVKDIQVKGNRPFPRLTLPKSLDRLYALVLRPTIPLWRKFDNSGGALAKFWGAGWWFWGYK